MIFVLLQFSSIILLIFYTNFTNINFVSYSLIALSIIIGILALKDMQMKNLNILPELKTNHILITTGIYQYIRHPMYLSLFIFGLSLLLTNFNFSNIIIYLILLITLYLKSNLEEKYLLQKFTNYQKYQQTTGRFFFNNLNKITNKKLLK